MTPACLTLSWRDPIAAFQPLADEPGATLLLGGGRHELAQWSYILPAPLRSLSWTEGDPGHPFDGLRESMAAIGHLPPPEGLSFAGGWVGCLSYELGRAFEKLPWPGGDRDGWQDLDLGLHDTVAAFDSTNETLRVVSWGLDEELKPNPALARARAVGLAARLAAQPVPKNTFARASLSPTRSRSAVEAAARRAIEYVEAGDVFQANISQLFTGYLGDGDTPWELFRRLSEASPAPFAAYRRTAGRALVSHSPERFVSVTPDGWAETRPIKGTRRRGATSAEDARLARELQSSLKDRAENLMIVDLMRNDLARVCEAGSVSVPRLFGLETFSTLHHLVSDVRGKLRSGLTSIDLLAASFPPGSVTGAPKVRAMEIIAELEDGPRGPYCGSLIRMGFHGALDSSVLIRTAACVEDGGKWRVSFRAGGGIVADSRAADEADETLVKARALLTALGLEGNAGGVRAAVG